MARALGGVLRPITGGYEIVTVGRASLEAGVTPLIIVGSEPARSIHGVSDVRLSKTATNRSRSDGVAA